jgi:hypothetical protein
VRGPSSTAENAVDCAADSPCGGAVDAALASAFVRAVDLGHDAAAAEIALELQRRCEARGDAGGAATWDAAGGTRRAGSIRAGAGIDAARSARSG